MPLMVYHMHVRSVIVHSKWGKVMTRKAVVLSGKGSRAAVLNGFEAGEVLVNLSTTRGRGDVARQVKQ